MSSMEPNESLMIAERRGDSAVDFKRAALACGRETHAIVT